jgi:hypothetical protein
MSMATAPAINVPVEFQFCEAIAGPSRLYYQDNKVTLLTPAEHSATKFLTYLSLALIANVRFSKSYTSDQVRTEIWADAMSRAKHASKQNAGRDGKRQNTRQSARATKGRHGAHLPLFRL